MKITVSKTSIEIIADENGFCPKRFADVAELTLSIWKEMYSRSDETKPPEAPRGYFDQEQ